MTDPILPGSAFGSAGRARSFTWSHVLFRAIWNMVWALTCSWTPPQLYAWRRFVLNLFGADVARGARVYGSAKVWYPPNLKMGKGAVLGPHTVCYCMDTIVLEDFAEVAQYNYLAAGTHDIESATFQLTTRPIRICSYAWLAAGGFVGPGVTVAEGAVLAARGVTFRDLDAWTVYVGNPAQPTRARGKFIKEDAA